MQFYHAWFAGSTAAVSRLWCGRPAIEHRQGEHGFYLEPGHHVGPSLALDMTILEDDLPHERLEHLGRHANVSPPEFLESLPLGGELPIVTRQCLPYRRPGPCRVRAAAG